MIKALIFAGGVGRRMHSQGLPKQFLTVNSKPIIIYTLEKFQFNNNIDSIVVVCIKDYIDYLNNLIQQYHLNKIEKIVEGGDTGQESIFNGLKYLQSKSIENDIVLIHDGVRPIINDDLINSNILSVKKYGCAISAVSAVETVCLSRHGNEISEILDRNSCILARAPQSFYLKDIYENHCKAQKEKKEFVDSASLMKYYGTNLFYVETDQKNIKITTPVDFYIFKTFIKMKESFDVLGL